MKYIRIVMLTLLFFGCVASEKTVQKSEPSTWDRYVPLTFKQIMKEHDGAFQIKAIQKQIANEVQINGLATKRPYLIQSIYLESIRPIKKERKELIQMWGKSFNIPKYFTDLFQHEVAFEIEGKTFWCPFQEPNIPFLKSEANRGSSVDIYAMLIGSFLNGENHEPVFIVNDFKAK